MNNKPKYISINLWDDYYDDGYVPEGKFQETYMYVEEHDYFTEDMKIEAMGVVLEHLKTLDLDGVEIKNCGSEINFKHLTHVRREQLVKELEVSGLTYNDIPIDIYSES